MLAKVKSKIFEFYRSIVSARDLPDSILLMQGMSFLGLYAIWGLPETIFFRHFFLILGAFISLYAFYVYRRVLTPINLLPLIPIFVLFMWVSFHLLFLSEAYDSQLVEYFGIWKRVFIGSIFAVGFGVSLNQIDNARKAYLLKILFFSSIVPVIIFYIKYFYTNIIFGIFPVPDYLLLYEASAKFFVPKTTYVCFAIPALGISLSIIKEGYLYNKFSRTFSFFALLMVLAIFMMFYLMNIKNGIVYSLILSCLLLVFVVKKFIITHTIKTILGVLIIFILGSILIFGHVKNNPSWRTILVDAKVALKVNEIQNWKYSGLKGYPRNEMGEVVSVTNYDRIAWGITGVHLLIKNPLGYGLVERSYGQLASKEYPDSKLHQSHSGWLDLALGVGFPGLFIIFLSLAISLWRACKYHNFWESFIFWTSVSITLMWCTTELSQKVYFDSLIFWICLFIGLTLNPYPERRSN
jgi:hypothetical protein